MSSLKITLCSVHKTIILCSPEQSGRPVMNSMTMCLIQCLPGSLICVHYWRQIEVFYE